MNFTNAAESAFYSKVLVLKNGCVENLENGIQAALEKMDYPVIPKEFSNGALEAFYSHVNITPLGVVEGLSNGLSVCMGVIHQEQITKNMDPNDLQASLEALAVNPQMTLDTLDLQWLQAVCKGVLKSGYRSPSENDAIVKKETPSTPLQLSGSLIYRLTDHHRPQNCDEIKVTMANGSREADACNAKANEIFQLLKREEESPAHEEKNVDYPRQRT